MEFDKSKVYTALNADELQIGSKCIFADTVKGLRRKVEEDTYRVETFYRLHNNGGDDLFVGNDCAYCYAYLIESPNEPKYKPFESAEKAMKVIMAHGGWVKRKNTDDYYLVNGCHSFGNDLYIYIDPTPYNPTVFLGGFVFTDDCSPCGELVEE